MSVFKQGDLFSGRYLLEMLIGEGGFSEVWKAKDLMAEGAIVAIKIYAPEKGLEDFGIRQFSKEYSIMHNIQHPHLMKLYHYDVVQNSPYLIMPYYPSGSLSKLIYSSGTLNEKSIATLMYQIGGALNEIHIKKPSILHHDVKPDNILLLDKEYFVLTDFGISSQTRHTLSKATNRDGSLTIAYSSPEKFSQNNHVSEASDIFSFGITLYEACTGLVPWEGNGGQCLLIGAQIPSLPKNFPFLLNEMIQQCMSIDPEARPTAGKIMEWGHFFLRNNYWNKSEVNGKKVFLIEKMKVILPVFILVSLVSILLIFFLSKYKQLPIDAHTIREMPAENSKIAGSQPAKMIDKIQNKVVYTIQNKKPQIHPSKMTSSKALSHSSYSVEAYFNKISDPSIPRKTRKNLLIEAKVMFANDSVSIYEQNKSFYKRHTVSHLLNILLDIPHQVRFLKLSRDKDFKISEASILLIAK